MLKGGVIEVEAGAVPPLGEKYGDACAGPHEPSNPSIEVVHRAEESAETSSDDASSQTQVMKMWHLGRTQPAQQRRPSPIRAGTFNAPGTSLRSIKWLPCVAGASLCALRLLSIGAVITSIAWLVASGVFLIEGLKLSDLMALLPHELGGMAAGVVTPLALLWIVVAYFERSKIYEKEAFALRWHLNQLTFPSDDAHVRTTKITDVLRDQAKLLTQASEEASRRAQAASDLIRVQTASLIAASEKTSLNADSVGEKLRQQVEDLVTASDRAIARAREAGNVLHHQSHDLINVSQKAASRTEDITHALKKSGEDLIRVSDEAAQIARDTVGHFTTGTDRLETVSREAGATADKIQAGLELKTDNLTDAARGAAALIEASGERLSEHAVNMTRQSDHAAQQSEIMGNVLVHQAGVVSETLMKSASQSDDVMKRMMELRRPSNGQQERFWKTLRSREQSCLRKRRPCKRSGVRLITIWKK